MNTFALKIVTPDGTQYDGQAEALTVRTTAGDLGILAGHTDLAATLAPGTVTVTAGETSRRGHCSSGFLTVLRSRVTLLCHSFQWNDTP